MPETNVMRTKSSTANTAVDPLWDLFGCMFMVVVSCLRVELAYNRSVCRHIHNNFS